MGTRAAVYCRISRDPEGIRAGVERQEADCRALAERSGYAVTEVFTDNDISASTLSKKKRPAYSAMLEAAKAGDIDVIIAYSNSRLTRRLRELLDLIELHERHGVKINTVVSGQYDLATADGRMVASIMGAADQAEAERAGERIARAHLQRVRSGVTNHGGRPFGWADDKIHLHPVEAPLVRDAAEQVIAGTPTRVITRDWNRKGIRTARGKEWTHTTLRRMLQRVRLIGWRTHRREIAYGPDGQPIRGEWEPLLDRDTFDRVQAVFAEDGRHRRSSSRRYLLSGIIRCSVCSARMYGMTTAKSYAYTCSNQAGDHTVTITGPKTEQAVVELVQAKLAREDLPEPDIQPVFDRQERLDQIPELIGELMAAFNAGQLSGAVVFGQVAQLEAEQAELSEQRRQFIVATAHPARPADADQIEVLDVDRQRAVLSTLLDAVFVRPAGRRGEPWTPDRMTIVWKQG